MSEIFDHDHFALVVTSQRCYDRDHQVSEKLVIFGIVTRIDLLNFIVTHRRRADSVEDGAHARSPSTAAAPSPTAAQHRHAGGGGESEMSEEKKEAVSVMSLERM